MENMIFLVRLKFADFGIEDFGGKVPMGCWQRRGGEGRGKSRFKQAMLVC